MYLFRGADEATYKRQLEQSLEMRAERVSKVAGLDAAQESKLKLAVQGDLGRFYREIMTVREATKALNIQNAADQQRAWQEVMPLQQRAAKGILDENSLFEKMLSVTLTAEQREKYDNYLRERDVAHFTSILKMTVADMEKSLPLTERQRTELIQLVVNKPFPRRIPIEQEAYVGYIILSRLSDLETANLLDEHQQKTFAKWKQQYGNFGNGVRW